MSGPFVDGSTPDPTWEAPYQPDDYDGMVEYPSPEESAAIQKQHAIDPKQWAKSVEDQRQKNIADAKALFGDQEPFLISDTPY